MGAPQIVYLVLVGSALLIAANRHGKPKKGNESFWDTFISASITLTILYIGGFFS